MPIPQELCYLLTCKLNVRQLTIPPDTRLLLPNLPQWRVRLRHGDKRVCWALSYIHEFLKSFLKNKKESRICDSLDYQGASTSLIIALGRGGCHPFFGKELIKSEQATLIITWESPALLGFLHQLVGFSRISFTSSFIEQAQRLTNLIFHMRLGIMPPYK